MAQVEQSSQRRALGSFQQRQRRGWQLSGGLSLKFPHMSYKQAQRVFSVTQLKSISSGAFIVCANKESQI